MPEAPSPYRPTNHASHAEGVTARRTVEPEPVSESVNLREVLAVLRRNRWLVLAVAMVAFGLSAFVALRTVPLYRAKAVIRVANTRQAITGGLSDEVSRAPSAFTRIRFVRSCKW